MRLIKSPLILVLIGLTVASCDLRQSRVVIKQGAPQEFIISGHGLLDDFVVNGPDDQRGVPYSKVYWELHRCRISM